MMKVPSYIAGSFDPHHHKTNDDILYLVQHEVDLYEEGEENDLTPRTYRQAKALLAKGRAQ